MTEQPSVLELDIWDMPGIWPSCLSSGAVTDETMTSGPAPG